MFSTIATTLNAVYINLLLNVSEHLNSSKILKAVFRAIPADASGYFQNVENKFETAINTVIPFVWIAAAAAIVGCGLMCIIGSDRSREIAKSKFVAILIGCGLVLGSVHLAKGISSMLAFN